MAKVFGSSVNERVGLMILSHARGKKHKFQSFWLASFDTHAHIGNSTDYRFFIINLSQYQGSTHVRQQQKKQC